MKCNQDYIAKLVPMKKCGHEDLKQHYKQGHTHKRIKTQKRVRREVKSVAKEKPMKNENQLLNNTQPHKNMTRNNGTVEMHRGFLRPINKKKILKIMKKNKKKAAKAFKKKNMKRKVLSRLKSRKQKKKLRGRPYSDEGGYIVKFGKDDEANDSTMNLTHKEPFYTDSDFMPMNLPYDDYERWFNYSEYQEKDGPYEDKKDLADREYLEYNDDGYEITDDPDPGKPDYIEATYASHDVDDLKVPLMSKETADGYAETHQKVSNSQTIDEKECPDNCTAVPSVMVCAKCIDGVFKTFLSPCHLKIIKCLKPEEDLTLVARYPCILSAPYMPGHLLEQSNGETYYNPDDDKVLRFLKCQAGLSKTDPRCKLFKGLQ